MRILTLAKELVLDILRAVAIFTAILLTFLAGVYGLPLLILWRASNAIHMKPVGYLFHTLAWPSLKYIALIKPHVEKAINKRFTESGFKPMDDEEA